MRLRFGDKDLERLWADPTFVLPSLGPDLTRAYRKKVHFLAQAATTQDLRAMKSFRLEKLRGNREGQHSIRLNDQWRLILRFETDETEELVVAVLEVVDYH